MATGRIQNILTLRASITPPAGNNYYDITREIRLIDCMAFNPGAGVGRFRIWMIRIPPTSGVSIICFLDPGAVAQTVARPTALDVGTVPPFFRTTFLVGLRMNIELRAGGVANKKVICQFIPPNNASTTQTLT